MKRPFSSSNRSRCARILIVAVACMLFAAGSDARSGIGQGRTLPDGPGKMETQKVCSGCHEIEKTLSLRQDRTGWHRTIEKMISLGAKATDQEFDAVVEYLTKHFPADDVPLVKINQATAIELESGLSLKRSQAAAIIRYRNEVGRFKNLDDLKKVPGIDVAHIEARKDRLSFED
ncbi:MAG: helix-hairpin-helix domain-containing protein [Acidobacteriota bacterium]